MCSHLDVVLCVETVDEARQSVQESISSGSLQETAVTFQSLTFPLKNQGLILDQTGGLAFL